MLWVSKILASLVFIVIGFLALSPLGAGIGEERGAAIAGGGALIIGLIVLLAPSGRRAWGRGFLLNGALFVAMPILVLPLIGSAYQQTVDQAATTANSAADNAAASIGAGIGAAAAFGAFSFVGIILGIIFLVFGAILALGGRREVVIVHQSK